MLLAFHTTLIGAAETSAPIDRHALVTRHNVELDQIAPQSGLQIGNGNFAFTADVTGLQTFYGYTLSNWGWHEEPVPPGMKPEDRKRSEFITHGRKPYYLAPHHQPELVRWLYDNPHRANLGRLRFVTGPDCRPLKPTDLKQIRQRLDLWSGLLLSEFELNGQTVQVESVCHPTLDTVAVRIVSPVLADGQLSVVLDFPYPVPKGNEWGHPDSHQTKLTRSGDGRVDLVRKADALTYQVALAWSEGATGQDQPGSNRHAFRVSAKGRGELTLICAYSANPIADVLPAFEEVKTASATMWANYWISGGAIDFSASKDERWKELERRIILSQYLMRVNSAGSMPPPEIGLYGIDQWRSKFHLEMTAWHGIHFMLWGHPECVQGWVRWFQDVGLPSAKREAAAEGWPGAKWLKTPDPFGRWESWDHGPNRVTQNAHAFYWAEVFYRAQPTKETLETWKNILFETATMMAEFVAWDDAAQRYIMGPPVMSGAEGNSGFGSWNSTSELNYWAMSLEIAQRWRERLGLAREPKWDHILQHLSHPSIKDGVYIDAESHPEVWNQSRPGNFLRPAWFEVYGCIRGPLIDPSVMELTYERAARELRSGEWKGNLWGCDYPMMAMTAARLGKSKEAIDWLLPPTSLNNYSPTGFCAGWYLPGNGGLLWATAMMAAGWDGCPDKPAPGFPSDGSWTVKWEGLEKAP